jgi:hypothetical protein
VRLTEVRQEEGTVVVGDGDLVHFGVCTADGSSSAAASSTNEAVNFLPVQWLRTGLPRLLDWLRWLRDCWLPAQQPRALRRTGALRAAMRAERTNELLALHCAPLWCHALLTRLQQLLLAAPTTGGSADKNRLRCEIQATLKEDGVREAQRNVEAALALMEEQEVKRWLLLHSKLNDETVTEYL